MRVESSTGVLLFWPPHEGIIYSIAGPVSRNVRIILIGTKEEIKAAMKMNRWGEGGQLRLAPEYEFETRRGEVTEHSHPIPEPSELIVRPAKKTCRDCGKLVEAVDAFGECVACAAKWAETMGARKE